jgi:hypothetical protein
VHLFIEAAVRGNARPLLFAGAVRDAIFTVEHGMPISLPRDFDIGLLGMPRKIFDGFLGELKAQPNRYGGYRLEQQTSTPIDVWRLEETLGIRIHEAPCAVTNVLRSFVLDVNALVFDPLAGLFQDCGAIAAIQARRINLVAGALLHSTATFAAKAVVTATRFSLETAEPLTHFISNHHLPSTTTYEATKVFGDRICLQSVKDQQSVPWKSA